MSARQLIGAEYKVLGSAKQTIASPATTAFDFGTPNDLYLPRVTTFKAGMRVLVVCTASTAGKTSTLTWVLQDADDNAGSIGIPAAAAAAVTDGTLAGGTGDDFKVFGLTLQYGRPWLRASVTHATATDNLVCHCLVLGLPAGLQRARAGWRSETPAARYRDGGLTVTPARRRGSTL